MPVESTTRGHEMLEFLSLIRGVCVLHVCCVESTTRGHEMLGVCVVCMLCVLCVMCVVCVVLWCVCCMLCVCSNTAIMFTCSVAILGKPL